MSFDGYFDVPAAKAPMVPANPEAEQAVLGSLLIDPPALVRVASILQPDDFYQEKNGWIYQAILDMDAQSTPADFLTVTDELERRRQLDEVGGPAYVMDLINAVPTAVYVEHYARIVERTSVLRKMIRASGQVAQLAFDGSAEIDQTIAKAEGIMFGALSRRTTSGLSPISQSLTGIIDRIESVSRTGVVPGIRTGFTLIDEILLGLHKSDLLILAARPGMGKSALAMNIAYNVAEQGGAAAIFSLEMAKEQITQRLLARVSQIDGQRLRAGDIKTDDDWHRLMEAAGRISSMRIHVDDTPGITVPELRRRAMYMQATEGLDLLVVDYLQLMGSAGRTENRQQEVSAISRGLKNLARELDVPVLALSQLSRALEMRSDKRPMLSDLRESGSIEMDSDVVMFIYREDMYVENSERPNVADVIIAKQRNGPTGVASLYFRAEHQRFSDLKPTERVPLEYTSATHAAYATQGVEP